jgi:uncharacterized protein with PIN domain
MRKPSMTPEVLEAIHLMFEDYPDIEADCYLYLSALNTDNYLLSYLSDQAKNELNRMNRCVVCGDKLDYYTFTEEYNELEYRDKKNVNEWYCPNCNIFY